MAIGEPANQFPVMSPLHDSAAAGLLLRSVGVLALVDLQGGGVSVKNPASTSGPNNGVAYLSPYGRNHEVAGVVAVADEPVEIGDRQPAVLCWVTNGV